MEKRYLIYKVPFFVYICQRALSPYIMKRILPFSLFLLTVVCSSCSSLTYFDLPLYDVAETPFPAIAGDIVLVNNAVEQPIRSGSFLVHANNKEQRLLFDKDSAAFPMLDMLGQQLLETEFVEDVTIYKTAFRTDSLYRNAARLTPNQLSVIAAESGASWILSLDAIPYRVEIKEKILSEFQLVDAILQIHTYPVFRLYQAGNSEPVKHYFLKDTVAWKSTQFDFPTAISLLPPLDQCFNEALYMAGEKAVNRWLPHRINERRCWVNHPHSVMREATTFLINDDKESAAYMWEYGYDNIKNPKIRYYAAYNLAVLAELTGDLSKALGWLDKADQLKLNTEKLHPLKIEEMRASIKQQMHTQEILKEIF